MKVEKTKFKVGDLVQLLSGGPTMVVESIYTNSCACQWFSGKKLEKGHFDLRTLIPAPPAGSKEDGNA
ncbi:MAG: DUF2158 domain-containing protein [Armatimonadetes bacterium]|nr:MAG: DUF2158 domain-containing protein [Armatimonadota bacterium]